MFITNSVSRIKYLRSRIVKSYDREYMRWKSYGEIPGQTKIGTETSIGVTQLQLYDGRRPRRPDPSRSLATRTIFLPACYRAFHFFLLFFFSFFFVFRRSLFRPLAPIKPKACCMHTQEGGMGLGCCTVVCTAILIAPTV